MAGVSRTVLSRLAQHVARAAGSAAIDSHCDSAARLYSSIRASRLASLWVVSAGARPAATASGRSSARP